MKHKKKIMMLIIMVLAIGFAAVTTTLVINGTGILATNEEDFDVYFSDAMLDGSDITNQISSDGRTITYTSGVLEIAGDKSVLEYTVVNNSTQYDAEIKITCELEGNNYVTIENSLQNQVIEAKGEREGILTAEMIKTSTEEREIPLECTITASAIERTTPGEESGEDGKLTTFSMYGHLVDEEGNEVLEETVVVYSNPVYGITDEHGYLYVEGIEKGSHTLYLMGKKSIEEVKKMSEAEVKEAAKEEVGITTSTTVVEFKNGYKFENFKIKRTTLVNVEIDPNNGEKKEHKELKQGMKYGKLNTPEKEGYKFIGWYTEDGEEITDRSTVTKDEYHKVIARYEAGVYEIAYDTNGGEEITTRKEVTYGEMYGELEVPSREGYTFIDWKDAEGNVITEETKVSKVGNHTLIAEWSNDIVEVTFEGNSGTVSETTKTVVYDKAYGTLPSGEKEGYTLIGWYTEATGGEEVKEDTIVKREEAHTLYARWEANTYTVTLDGNKGNVSKESIEVKYEGKYEGLVDPTREGYSFKGWYDEEGKDIISTSTVQKAKDHTLTAKWEANTYVVRYNANNGTISEQIKDVTFDSTYGELTEATRTGYEFVNWKDEDGNVITKDTKVSIAKDHEIKAEWKAKEYTLTLDAAGGSVTPESTKVTYDGTYGNLTNPSRTGYSFAGWYLENGTKVESTTKVTTASNHKVTARWNAVSYNVTFNANGGSVTGGDIQAEYDGTYGELPTASRTGYTFNGWFTATSGGTKVESTTKVTTASAHTLYAQWTANVYTITLNQQSGSNGTATIYLKYNTGWYSNSGATTSMTKVTVPTRTGYTFGGYYTSTGGAGTQIIDASGNILSNKTTAFSVNTTLYAKWTAKTYTVTYEANGGSVNPQSKTVTYNGTYGDLATPTRTGYVFKNWKDANGNVITSSSKVTTAGNHTLTAEWENDVVEVTFNGNNGTPSATAKIVTYDKEYGDLGTASRTGYTFKGWFTAASGGSQVTSTTKVTNAASHTLYAQWTAITYKVAYNANGGSGSMSSVDHTYDIAKNLTANTFTRTGYSFAGWNTKNDGSGTNYANSASVKNLSSTAGATVTLYAKWTANVYTITLNQQSGSNGTGTIYLKYNTGWYSNSGATTAISKVTIPTRTGYTFGGYYTSTGGAGTQIIDASGNILSNKTTAFSANTTLYAKWTANTYTVTVNANGGSIPSTSGWTGSGTTATKTVTYDGTYGALPTPTRDEYIFKGWYTATSNGTQVSSSTKVTNASNHNIYAIWKSITTCSGNICWTDHDKTETKTIGDTIKIGNEEFHIMSFSGSNMQLLSRYNLYVGGVYDYTNDKYTAYGTEATGIQNSEMLGVQEGIDIRKGVIAFSSETVHGTNYNTYEGSIVQGHVNKYSSYLKTQYGITNTGTLITADELKTLGCDIDNKTCTGSAYPWVYGTSYWTRTPRDTTYIYRVSSTGFYSSNGVYDGPNFNGVRPVIIVSTSII